MEGIRILEELLGIGVNKEWVLETGSWNGMLSENPSEKVCAVRCVRKAVRTPVSQGAVPMYKQSEPSHRDRKLSLSYHFVRCGESGWRFD